MKIAKTDAEIMTEEFRHWLNDQQYIRLRDIEGNGKSTKPEFEMWTSKGVVFIVQFYPQGGFDIYVQLGAKNDSEDTKRALVNFITTTTERNQL
jgi:hypothetical protein